MRPGENTAVAYTVEITRQDVSNYAEDGSWLDGDRREFTAADTVTDTYDPALDDGTGHVAWAVAIIRTTDASEASIDPVPAEVPEHAWLSGTYANPYTGNVTETSVRLTSGWTPAERAEVFRAVTSR